MTQEQLTREIADFEFWQHIQNECDRGYIRSGNNVMRKTLAALSESSYVPSEHDSTHLWNCGGI